MYIYIVIYMSICIYTYICTRHRMDGTARLRARQQPELASRRVTPGHAADEFPHLVANDGPDPA